MILFIAWYDSNIIVFCCYYYYQHHKSLDRTISMEANINNDTLINASYNLKVAEQQLIILAIINAKEQTRSVKIGLEVVVCADKYAERFGGSTDGAYEAMKRATDGLFKAEFTCSKVNKISGKVVKFKSRWIDMATCIDEQKCVAVVFGAGVIPLINTLDERFVNYKMIRATEMTNKYAVRLYEILMSNNSSTKVIGIDYLRKVLGVASHYPRLESFKRRVLEPAVAGINNSGKMKVNYSQQRKGRAVSAIVFTCAPIVAADIALAGDYNESMVVGSNDTLTPLKGLNDAQLVRIVCNPKFKEDYSYLLDDDSEIITNEQLWIYEMVTRIKKDVSLFSKRPIRYYLIH